jgi:FAD/FMN-containing dehydrogenase
VSGSHAQALFDTFGADVVALPPAIDPRYYTAYNEPPGTTPAALVRPRSVEEVARVLGLCERLRQPVVPQGGRTGLVRGAVPAGLPGGEVILSLERLAGIETIDRAAGTVTVRAGTLLQSLQEAIDAAGFSLGFDIGARGSCQIGGNLATNAGGHRAIRHGVLRDQVLGLEVVLADGTIVSALNTMIKNNAGYDVKQLFIGSEGTLGVITRAVLRLQPKSGTLVTALCALHCYEDVVRLLQHARRSLPGLVAFEAMWPAFYRFVTERTPGVSPPLTAAEHLYVLLEWEPPCAPDAGREACVEMDSPHDHGAVRLEALLADWFDAGIIADAALATSLRQAQDMWTLREGLAIDTLPHLINFDVSLPIGVIGTFACECEAALTARWPNAIALFFGHIGDSNIHIGVSIDDMHAAMQYAVDETVYAQVRKHGGTISAEHGIGQSKRAFLGYARSPAEIDLMRRFKAMLDPHGILNPGKVL